MASIIALAGATGNLGVRIAKALRQQDAEVWALVRPETGEDKLAGLIESGCTVVKVDLADAEDLQAALEGADMVVSALQGLRDVIVDTQTDLLNAALAVNVRRFIPSDYAADFTKTADEPNRNFDMRREFGGRARCCADRGGLGAQWHVHGPFGLWHAAVRPQEPERHLLGRA